MRNSPIRTVSRPVWTLLAVMLSTPAFSQQVPTSAFDLKLTFDPASSLFFDLNGQGSYNIRNAVGTGEAQIFNGYIAVEALQLQFDAFVCSPLATCTNYSWRHFTANIPPFVAPVTVDPISGGARVNAIVPVPGATVQIANGSAQPLVSPGLEFDYVGPPTVDAPLTSYDFVFEFNSPELGTLIAVDLASSQFQQSAISFNLSNAATAGSTLWFNSNAQLKDIADGTTISLRHSFLTIGQSGYTVPDADIVFSSGAQCSSTRFDGVRNRWITTVPLDGDDEVFLDGIAVPVPVAIPKNTKAAWNTTVYSTFPVSFNWKGGAAAFSSFSTDYNALLVKPSHQSACNFNNGDHGGTPEAYPVAIPGGTGGGGSNRTGGFSGTQPAVVIFLKTLP